ncbi:hypothetical protein GCM10027456_69460 [Kineosporia babensis]
MPISRSEAASALPPQALRARAATVRAEAVNMRRLSRRDMGYSWAEKKLRGSLRRLRAVRALRCGPAALTLTSLYVPTVNGCRIASQLV